MVDQPTAQDALAALEPLLGEWTLEARWPNGDVYPGRTTFEWLDPITRRHLVQRVTIEHPMAPESVSVMGCDAANGTYMQLYTDERDVCRIVEMWIDDGEWRLERRGDPFAQRFTGTFSEDGTTITGRWEIDEDGEGFELDFELDYRKAGAAS
jgi:hypothetical protein